MEFARNNYERVYYINFWDNPEWKDDFAGSLVSRDILINISSRFEDFRIVPGRTLIVIDEIQECPRARLFFKNAYLDGRYDLIGSGSYLGIRGYGIGDGTPIPVGYETRYHMKTMDFEEWLWANGHNDGQVSFLRESLREGRQLPPSSLSTYSTQFTRYCLVGGFPSAVVEFLLNDSLSAPLSTVEAITEAMSEDFGRRLGKDGKPVFDKNEVARIRSAFSLIPTMIARENNRYVVGDVEGGNHSRKLDAISYLEEAGVAKKAYNLENLSLPYEAGALSNQFKLFPTDISLLTSLYHPSTRQELVLGRGGQNVGGYFEAVVFDSLYKAGFSPYYHLKPGGPEIDFLIPYDGVSTMIEVKAGRGRARSAKTVLANPSHYGKTKLIKIGDYNVGRSEDTLTLPHFMTFLLGDHR